jgi:glutamyl-tRNA reductase
VTASSSIPHRPPLDATWTPELRLREEDLPRPLLVYGIASCLGSTPLEVLEERARLLSRAKVRAWFSEFEGTEEAALLSTCHRVELFLLVRAPREVDRWIGALPGPATSWQVREGADVVRHLFRVSAGRESLAQGEAEVRQQVRIARAGIESRHRRPVLAGLFSAAIDAAERAPSSDRPTRSIAAEAVRMLHKLVDRPNPRVLVIGGGTVGRRVAALLAPTARVTLAYHLRPPPDPYVQATQVRPIPFERVAEELRTSDAIVTAIKSGTPCVRAADLPVGHPLTLIDLGVPRNIDPNVRELPLVRLVDLEELYTLSSYGLTRGDEDLRVERLASRYSVDLDSRLREVWVQAWLGAVEAVRRAELENARRFWGTLTPAQEVAVDRLTRRLVARLFAPPARRLRALPAGPEGDQRRRLAWELLRPDPAEP